MSGVADIDVSRRNKKPRLLQDNERARLEEFYRLDRILCEVWKTVLIIFDLG